MYYALIIISVVIFGISFASTDAYTTFRGSHLKTTLEFSFVSSLFGLAALLLFYGSKFTFTPFTLVMALLSALDGIAFYFCSFKALSSINLSLFSVFSMLGGMLLPFLQGIIFFEEGISAAKIICVCVLTAALFLTVQPGEKSRGWIYYIGIFILNGMYGVLAKFFTSAPFEKANPESFSILIAASTAVISLAALLLFFHGGEKTKPTKRGMGISAAAGLADKIGNLILVIALAHVDASVQYPMVTGGVMIVSTLICFFGKKKPSRREIASVAVAFLGLMILFLFPA